MRIKSITLKNFQCYYGTARLDFCDGLNLLLGANGYGKSKLYDAFYWLFEDRISFEEKWKTTPHVGIGIANDKAQSECAVGDKLEVSVEMIVEHSDKNFYQLIRTCSFTHKPDGFVLFPAQSQTSAFYLDVLDYKPVSDTFDVLCKRIIPSDIRPYIWFQGEKGIDALVNTTDQESLSKVIAKLSNISRWEIFKTVYDKLEETATAELRAAGLKTKKNINEITEQQEKLKSAEKEIQELTAYIESDEDKYRVAEEQQKKYVSQIADSQKIIGWEKDLGKSEKSWKQAAETQQKKVRGFTAQLFEQHWLLDGMGFWVDAYAEKFAQYDADKRALESAKTGKTPKFKLPANIPDPEKLKQMLNEGRCFVCNQAIEAGSAAAHFIQEKLDNDKQTATVILDSLNDHSVYFKRLRDISLRLLPAAGQTTDGIVAYIEEQMDLKETETKWLKECDELREQILDTKNTANVDNAQEINANFLNEGEIMRRSTENIGRNKQKLKTAENNKAAAEKELQTLTKGDKTVELAEDVKSYIADIAKIADNAKERVYLNLIRNLQAKANEHYANICKTGEAFTGNIVFEKIGKGYTPKIKSGGVEIVNLNQANIGAMKLSLIFAIITFKEHQAEHYPLISDAMLSSFDPIKGPAALKEAGRVFSQSVIILKEFLRENSDGGYTPDKEALRKLKDGLPEGKPLKVFELKTVNEGGEGSGNRSKVYSTINELLLTSENFVKTRI